MAQTLSELERDGLIARSPDPGDRRRALVELTEAGRRGLDEDRRHREGWLAQTISRQLTAQERRALADALGVLRKLADS
jgi:DNA-binding MarR family transcriptional regulator